MRPSLDALGRLLENAGVPLEGPALALLWAYHQRLRAANAELNLTRIHNFENMVLKHYVDSLMVPNLVELRSPLMDVGSGPGLPGLPIKIARPGLHVVLAEPRGARAEFLRETVAALGLEGAEVYDRKVTPKFERKMATMITRAVASVPETLEMVANALPPGGQMVFMKGPDCDDEVAEAARTCRSSFRKERDLKYVVPGTDHRRRLLVYERLSPTTGGVSMRVPHEALSEGNPTFRKLRALLKGAGIREHGEALLSGAKFVAEALARRPERAVAWVTDAQTSPPSAGPAVWHRLSGPLFRELDVAGTGSPLLLVKAPEFAEWSDEGDWPEGCTLFVPFQDPENVGAVIRTAAAFGAARVVLLKGAAHPFHPKSARAAGPSLFEVETLQGPALADLRSDRFPIVALSMEGPALYDAAPWPERFGLVVGAEGPGLPEGLREGPRLRAPIAPGVESLNAAVAVAVALYEWRRPKLTGG